MKTSRLGSPPRELPYDTLRTLADFIPELDRLSRLTAAAVGTGDCARELRKLVDGISVFVESISTVKLSLRIGEFAATDPLESELLEILKDVLEAFQKRDHAALEERLATRLPANLTHWLETGIPALIRSRDS